MPLSKEIIFRLHKARAPVGESLPLPKSAFLHSLFALPLQLHLHDFPALEVSILQNRGPPSVLYRFKTYMTKVLVVVWELYKH